MQKDCGSGWLAILDRWLEVNPFRCPQGVVIQAVT